MRKAITFLQSAARLRPEEPVTSRDICEIAGVCPMNVKLLVTVLKYCILKQTFSTKWNVHHV